MHQKPEHKRYLAAGAALALALAAPFLAIANCFDDAAQYHNVNRGLSVLSVFEKTASTPPQITL